MPRPGVTVELVEDAPSGQAVLDSGQAFFAGVAERSPDHAIRVASLSDYEANFGDRAGGSLLHDSVGAYFTEGGAVLYVSAIAGPAAEAATGTLAPFTVDARGAGAWGNQLAVRAEDAAAIGGPGAVQLVVAYKGADVERSPALASPQALVTWAQNASRQITLTYTTGALAPAAAVTLAGGADDTTVDAATLKVALDRFTYELGPGQAATPGLATALAYDALLEHVDDTRRVALLDAPDSPDPLVVGAAATGLQTDARTRYAAMFAPWAIYPGPATGVTVTVPYSAVQAGLIARLDAQTQNPNLAAAGVNGITRGAIGLTQTYTDTDRETLNTQGVTIALSKYGTIRTYGARSAAGPAELNWMWFGGARVVMQVAHQADAIGENYVL
ncbi:MAG TPA: hypothetical protein VKB54_17285, partial [Solirubrobacteraceae bacterium]|nr:hypothetical protein [Solirubrobacteraceae bacterium]